MIVDHLVRVAELQNQRFFSADLEQLLYRVLNPVNALIQQVQIAGDGFGIVGVPFQGLDTVLHAADRVVDFMGNTGNQAAERCKLFALENLFAACIKFLLGAVKPLTELAVMLS